MCKKILFLSVNCTFDPKIVFLFQDNFTPNIFLRISVESSFQIFMLFERKMDSWVAKIVGSCTAVRSGTNWGNFFSWFSPLTYTLFHSQEYYYQFNTENRKKWLLVSTTIKFKRMKIGYNNFMKGRQSWSWIKHPHSQHIMRWWYNRYAIRILNAWNTIGNGWFRRSAAMVS